MNEIKIESGITMGGRSGPLRVAMSKMKVGDSFVCPKGSYANVLTIAHRLNIKMARRGVDSTTIRMFKVRDLEIKIDPHISIGGFENVA